MLAPRSGSLKFEKFISLVLQRNYAAIKLVISADDFDINKEDFRGVTVLHYAAELDDVELIEMILKQHPKVKINAKTLEMMSTPLMIAAGNGKVQVVKVLLEHGADAACQNAAGFTALMMAAEGNHVDCVDLLLNSGKDCRIKAQNLNGHNALMLAFNSVEITKKLIGHSNIKQKDSEGNTALHLSVSSSTIDVMHSILSHHPDILIEARNYKGRTALHCAVQQNKLKMADFLICSDSSLFELDSKGLNVYQYAAIYDDTEEFLKKYECPDVEVEPLFLASAEYGRLSVLESFVNIADEKCLEDSLILASKGGHLDCIDLLMKHMKSPDDNILLSAGLEALSSNHFDAFYCLYERLSEGSNNSNDLLKKNESLILSTAFLSGCFEACELFLEQGIDPNGEDPETYLMVSSVEGNVDIVRLLIKYKADVNRVHEKLGSALLLATINDRLEIVDVLLKNGADPSISDESGFTPLITAAYYGYNEIFLRIFEVDKNLKQKTTLDGLTPLLAAVLSGRIEIVEKLLDNGTDIKEIDGSENNCLHCAAENPKGFNTLLFLVNHLKDDLNLLDFFIKSPNKDDQTPLDYIISHKNQKIIYSLIANQSKFNDYFSTSNEVVIENVENNDMCLICRDDFELEDVATKLPCGHLFHKFCYDEWSVTKPNCPYCQRFPFKVQNR